jgi:23S rRNA (uracil1939-C5)-methyltransferase
LVDPPRSGLAWQVRTFLLEEQPARVTYVSCHPATLARDLRALAPGFTVESVTALDLFPQTGHLEAVVQLVASGS